MFKIDVEKEISKGPPQQTIFASIISAICVFANGKCSPEAKITFMNRAINIMDELSGCNTASWRHIAFNICPKLLEQGNLELAKNEKPYLLNLGNALRAALDILESDSLEWKNALIFQLEATKEKLITKRDTLLQQQEGRTNTAFFAGHDQQSHKRTIEHTSFSTRPHEQDQETFKPPAPIKKPKETQGGAATQNSEKGDDIAFNSDVKQFNN